jgi:hypothetical protein
MQSNVRSKKDQYSSYKSHIGGEVEESVNENFAVNNMYIDDEEVGSLVPDAIESYDITSDGCVSPSSFIHSQPNVSVYPPLTILTLLMRSVIPSLFGNVK